MNDEYMTHIVYNKNREVTHTDILDELAMLVLDGTRIEQYCVDGVYDGLLVLYSIDEYDRGQVVPRVVRTTKKNSTVMTTMKVKNSD